MLLGLETLEKQMKRLAYVLIVIGGFLGLSLSLGMANRAIDDLVAAEDIRTNIVARNLDHLPNTYDIFTKLNRISTTGLVATPAQKRVIARSVMGNAMLVDDFQTLMV